MFRGVSSVCSQQRKAPGEAPARQAGGRRQRPAAGSPQNSGVVSNGKEPIVFPFLKVCTYLFYRRQRAVRGRYLPPSVRSPDAPRGDMNSVPAWHTGVDAKDPSTCLPGCACAGSWHRMWYGHSRHNPLAKHLPQTYRGKVSPQLSHRKLGPCFGTCVW